MITKDIIFFSSACTIACDAKCEKAWGINSRPKIKFDKNDPDDYAFLADNELDNAPADPGTYEGSDGKPQSPEERLNRWCCRECERCSMVDRGKSIVLKDFSKRVYNKRARELLENDPSTDA
jgi:hypothetical protein